MTIPQRAFDAKGNPIEPIAFIVPILKRHGEDHYRVVGTGFYITRYGLLATAGHVLETILDRENRTLRPGYVIEFPPGKSEAFARQIVHAAVHNTYDVGIAQADNGVYDVPSGRMANGFATLTLRYPSPGTPVTTWAYPENDTLVLDGSGGTVPLNCRYYDGVFLRYVNKSEHPFIPYPHYETTIDIKGGASGGPVFGPHGRVIGVACRGWEFQGAEHEGAGLSYLVPIAALLSVVVELVQLPVPSWEAQQVPSGHSKSATVAELAAWGHVDLDPRLNAQPTDIGRQAT